MTDVAAPMPDAAPSPRARAVGRIGAAFVGAIVLFGAFGKLIDPVGFQELIEVHGLDFLIPSGVMVYIALFTEVFLGLALLLGIRNLVILVPTALMIGLFLYLTGSDYVRSLSEEVAHNCGCFGNLVDRSPAAAFWQDLLMLVPATALAFVGRPPAGAPLPLWRLSAVGVVSIAALVFAWKAPDLPIDDFATRLQPGLDVTDVCAGRDEDATCLDALDPNLVEGEHIVVIADIFDPAIQDPLNRYANEVSGSSGPFLLVVSPESAETLAEFAWSEMAPSYTPVHGPLALIRPLYRTLPRSFLVQDGRITKTWAGLPPFDSLAATDR